MKKLFLLAGIGLLSIGLFVNARMNTPAAINIEPVEHEIELTADNTDTLSWSVDPAHTNLKFIATHMALSEIEGQFKLFSGKMTYTKPDMSDAKIQFVVDVKSLDSGNEQRDTHLKSEEFFASDRHPKMIFRSTSFVPQDKERKKYKLNGKLTIRDVTKDVTFDVVYGGTRVDPYGNTKAGFKATTRINRFDYGLRWNTMTENVAIVGETIDIVCNIQMKRDKDRSK